MALELFGIDFAGRSAAQAAAAKTTPRPQISAIVYRVASNGTQASFRSSTSQRVDRPLPAATRSAPHPFYRVVLPGRSVTSWPIRRRNLRTPR
jgi:hypothetical protein